MNLKQEDKNLLNDFFVSQACWMRNNSLRTFKNLSEFKRNFLEFTKSRNCEDNLACKLFALTLEHELLKCEENRLIELYNKDMNSNQIKRVKLNYRPLTQPATDNLAILKWVEDSNRIEVSSSHINALNRSIQQKIERNREERRASYEKAEDFIVR